ncbi:MAG: PEP-CTERM sorting domain-containing protein [Roseibacillus sp.]
MKNQSTVLSLGVTAALLANAQSASLIAFWDFDNGFSEADEVVQITHPVTQGSGTLFQQRADTDGNGKGGVAFSAPEFSINALEDRSFAWDDAAKGGENDAEFFIQISTLGYQDITIRFDVEGNPDGGITSFDLKYSPNILADTSEAMDVVGTIKDFEGGVSSEIFNNEPFTAGLNLDAGFVEQVLDLSSVTALNNQPVLSLRFDDFDGNDDLRFDNILITGTAIPEPSSSLLLLLGSCALLRRGRSSKN